MTNGRVALGALLVGAVLIAGCGKKTEDSSGGAAGAADAPASTTATTPTPAATPVPTPTTVVSHDADAAAVRGCCAALRSAGAAQKVPTDKSKYDAAAASCDGIVTLVKNGTTPRSRALASVQAALHGQALPPGCN